MKFNIFNDRQLQRCSLASNELSNVNFDDDGLAISLAPLKCFSFSFSDRIIFRSRQDINRSHDPADVLDSDGNEEPRDAEEIRAEAAEERNFIGLAKFLKPSKHLEELELHQYNLRGGMVPQSEMHLERVLQYIAEAEKLPRLKRLELRGLHVRRQDLLSIIQRTKVRNVYLYRITIVPSEHKVPFDHFTSESRDTSDLDFDEWFDRTWRRVLDGLRDELPRTHEAASPTVQHRQQELYKEYGLPHRGFSMV